MKTEEIYYALLVETEMSCELPIKAFLFESGLYAAEVDTWEMLEGGGLLPCLTVVLYLSPADWGGYYYLHEMYKKTNETLKKYAPDYHLNIIEPAKITEDKIAELSGDLGGVLRFVQVSNDTVATKEFLSGGAFARMGRSAQNLILCIADHMTSKK
ncbi:MAG: hypothetical protein LUC87_01705 [Clostridiales bacterium]|nr:hypothetical protein [Clostridiales bacterium]